MKGLQIDFQLKRQTLLGKIMNYLLILAAFIVAMTFCVYVPYIGLVKEKNLLIQQHADAKNEYNQLINENADRTVNDAASKKYQADYETLKNALGTTKLSFTVGEEEVVFDGLDEEVGYYTSHQDKIKYILAAVGEFNKYYEDKNIVAKIEYIKIDSLKKEIKMSIIFEINSNDITTFRNKMKTYYLSKEFVPFVTSVDSQNATSGIDEGLELVLHYE